MPKQEVVVDETKKVEEEKPAVEVQLDENNQPIKPPDKKEEPKYVQLADLERISKAVENTRNWNQRKIEEINQKLEKLVPKESAPIERQVPSDEWDEKLQRDWKGTVRELAKLEAIELRKREQEEMRIQAEEYRNNQLREENKKKVLEKHKDLMDETSQKSEIFRQVIQEHQEYLPNPFGPVLAMRDMEDKLREMGVVDEPTKQVVEKEVARQARTNAGTLLKGTSSGTSNKVVLTKDEKEFCDAHNIKYEVYARNKKLTSTQTGVEA